MGGNAVTEQMALIKPDSDDIDNYYDRWHHKDTRIGYATGSSVSFMLADFVSAGFDDG
jgi:hypothetical protein